MNTGRTVLTDREVSEFDRDIAAARNLFRDLRKHLDNAPAQIDAAHDLAEYVAQLLDSLHERMRAFAERRGL